MLTVSPVRTSSNGVGRDGDQFLLEDISFDDLFVGFNDGDVLPDLEIDPSGIFADFSFSSGEESGSTAAAADPEKMSTCVKNENKESSFFQGEVEVVSGRTKEEKSALSDDGGKTRKPSSTKVSQGKKKTKVDWTPELHRRFVLAVEQLEVDKAVPSRILELMGIDCLTRHNIASHLQKYRSHRKHLLAREAEAASWSHRRQMYPAAHGGMTKMGMNPNWAAPPIIGFPPPMHQQPFRPLHVWGHPTVEHPKLVPIWPQAPWAKPGPPHAPPPADPSYWHHPHYRPLTQGTPCFPPPLMAAARFPAPPFPGIPPHPMFRPAPRQHNVSPPPPSKHSGSPQIQLDAQPSNECIDAAIGDVLAKPWLPLPLGLKPPSMESVMVELQMQGVAKVPPKCG